MSGKRGADHQITQLNYERQDESADANPGTWHETAKADEATLKERKVRKFKRPGGAGGGVAAAGVAPDGGPANPFASVQLVGGAAPPAANPFASVKLIPGGAPAAPPAFSFGTASAGAPANTSPFQFGGTSAPMGATAAPVSAAPTPAAAAPAGGHFSFGTPAPSLPPATAPADAPAPAAPPAANPFVFGSTPPAGGGSLLGGSSAGAPPVSIFGHVRPAPPADISPAPTKSTLSLGAAREAAPSTSPFASAPIASTTPAPASSITTSAVSTPAVVCNGGGGGARARASRPQLNVDFVAWMEEEWKNGAASLDWSDGVRDYIAQAKALPSGAPSASGGAPPSTPAPPAAAPPTASLFGAQTPQTVPPASQPAPAPAPTPSPSALATATATAADEPTEVFVQQMKLSVFRSEKRNDEGAVSSAAGWKPLGKGQMRLLELDGTHFVEFRPLVSEGGGAGNEAEDELTNTRSRFGRPMVSAALRADSDFSVKGKAVMTKLFSVSASGAHEYAMYHLPLGSTSAAEAFAELAKSKRPQP